jgi:hypothetical protein
VLHHPVAETNAGVELNVDAVVVSPKKPISVELFVMNGFRPRQIKMIAGKQFHYSAVVPKEIMNPGFLKYYIVVNQGDSSFTFPSGNFTSPRDWDFYDATSYSTTVVNPSSSIMLFNAFSDASSLVRKWLRTSSLVPGDKSLTALLNLNVDKLYEADNENAAGERIADYSMKFFFGDKIRGRKLNDGQYKNLVVRGHALHGKSCLVQVALLDKDGVAYGGLIKLDSLHAAYSLPLKDLQLVKTVTLPRPYPSFLPYYFHHSLNEFDLRQAEVLQISIGPGIGEAEQALTHGVSLESVSIE